MVGDGGPDDAPSNDHDPGAIRNFGTHRSLSCASTPYRGNGSGAVPVCLQRSPPRQRIRWTMTPLSKIPVLRPNWVASSRLGLHSADCCAPALVGQTVAVAARCDH